MRKAIFLIMSLLIFGAIINIMAAWGLLHYHRTHMGAAMFELIRKEEQIEWDAAMGPSQNVICNRDERSGVQRLFMMENEPTNQRSFLVIRAGWPMLGLRYQAITEWESESRAGLPKTVERGGWVLRSAPDKPMWRMELPCRPTWPGFALNTFFYASIIGLIFVPGLLRRWRGHRRLQRGLCPKCAYPIGTSNLCTECGAALLNGI